MSVNVQDYLNEAADLIEREGWWDGVVYGEAVGSHCLLTSLSEVTGMMAVSETEVGYALTERIKTTGFVPGTPVPFKHSNYAYITEYNDSRTSIEEILSILRATD